MRIFVVDTRNVEEKSLFNLNLRSLLSEKSLKKLNNSANLTNIVQTLMGELTLQYLAQILDTSQRKILAISYNDYGKPYFTNSRINFHFNISHTTNLVICAVDNKPIGADVEIIKNIEMESLMYLFHPLEAESLRLSEYDLNFFYSLWTAKESVLKFIGTGLSTPLNSFYVSFSDDKIYIKGNDDYPDFSDIYVKVYNYSTIYLISLCSSSNNFPRKIENLAAENIITFFEDMYLD